MLRPTLRNGKPNLNYQLWCDDPSCTDVISDDLVIMHLQYSSQWDSLAHVGALFDADGDGVAEPVYYNGFRAGQDVIGPAHPGGAGIFDFPGIPRSSTTQVKKLGIENMSERCVQGRGVMIDLHAHVGRKRVHIDYDHLMDILRQDQVTVESGDMVCLHTGYADMLLEMNRQPDGEKLLKSCAVLEGRDPKLLQWITDTGLVALIADNKELRTLAASLAGALRAMRYYAVMHTKNSHPILADADSVERVSTSPISGGRSLSGSKRRSLTRMGSVASTDTVEVTMV